MRSNGRHLAIGQLDGLLRMRAAHEPRKPKAARLACKWRARLAAVRTVGDSASLMVLPCSSFGLREQVSSHQEEGPSAHRQGSGAPSAPTQTQLVTAAPAAAPL